jgi:hypothetical protein
MYHLNQPRATATFAEDRRETADAVKRFCLEFRDAAESHLQQEGGVRGP